MRVGKAAYDEAFHPFDGEVYTFFTVHQCHILTKTLRPPSTHLKAVHDHVQLPGQDAVD